MFSTVAFLQYLFVISTDWLITDNSSMFVFDLLFFTAVVDQLSENNSAVKDNYHNRPLVAGYNSLTSPSYVQLYIMLCMVITTKINTLFALSLSLCPSPFHICT